METMTDWQIKEICHLPQTSFTGCKALNEHVNGPQQLNAFQVCAAAAAMQVSRGRMVVMLGASDVATQTFLQATAAGTFTINDLWCTGKEKGRPTQHLQGALPEEKTRQLAAVSHHTQVPEPGCRLWG